MACQKFRKEVARGRIACYPVFLRALKRAPHGSRPTASIDYVFIGALNVGIGHVTRDYWQGRILRQWIALIVSSGGKRQVNDDVPGEKKVMGFRKRTRKRSGIRAILDWTLTIAGLGILALAIVWLEGHNPHVLTGSVHVVDGDSLVLNGEKIRLKGIDAPEFKQLCQKNGKDWDCGRQSRGALRSMVKGRTVNCEAGSLDRYQRWLGSCTADGKNLNQALVEAGWAVDYGGYAIEERRARDAGLGIWAGNFVRPQEWRRANKGDAASVDGVVGAKDAVAAYFRGIFVKYFR